MGWDAGRHFTTRDEGGGCSLIGRGFLYYNHVLRVDSEGVAGGGFTSM